VVVVLKHFIENANLPRLRKEPLVLVNLFLPENVILILALPMKNHLLKKILTSKSKL